MTLRAARHLADVHYEIRGPIAHRAYELEKQGHSIIKLNIGNPGAFGFEAPPVVRKAIVDNLYRSDAYSHHKGIFEAREAVVAETRGRGIQGVDIERVFMGNGVSELILMCMEALLDPGDEVLLPAPDYPLWSAAVTITGAKPVYYPCRPQHAFVPDPDEVARLVTPRCKALVIISPNNPTGAVYERDIVERLVRIAERHELVCFSDEIYDRVLYDGAVHTNVGTLCEKTLCGTFGGLSKVHRACGYRAGWLAFSGKTDHAAAYIQAVELLASLRLCSNVPAQWAAVAALKEGESIKALTSETGRLGRQRKAVLDGVARSKYFALSPPRGALYAFVQIKNHPRHAITDKEFAWNLLEKKHVLVVPGSGFNVDYKDHFRTTLLPDETIMRDVFDRMEELLDEWAAEAYMPVMTG